MSDTNNSGTPQIQEGGPWRAEPTKFEVVKNKKEGEPPQIVVTFLLRDGPSSGRQVTWYGNMSTKGSIDFTRKVLDTLGWDGKVPLATEFKPTKDVTITMEHHTYQPLPATPTSEAKPAKTVARVKWINSLEGRGVPEERVLKGAERNAADAVLASLFGGSGDASSAVTSFSAGEDPVEEGKLPF